MSSVLQKQIGINAAPISLVGTTETVIAYSNRVEVPLPTVRAIVKGWALLTLGTAATGFVLRIRRGNGITGAVVAGGNILTFVAGNTVDSWIVFAESLQNAEAADYTLTAVQSGATGPGTVQFCSIEVELING